MLMNFFGFISHRLFYNLREQIWRWHTQTYTHSVCCYWYWLVPCL